MEVKVLYVVLLFVLCTLAFLLHRVSKHDVSLRAIQQRFHEVGINTAEQVKTDVVITEKWNDWDNLTDEEADIVRRVKHPRSEWFEGG